MAGLKKRVGADPKTISPLHHVTNGLPPTIIFHGKKDKTIPYRTAEAFTEAMVKAGNRCELKGYEGQGHGSSTTKANVESTMKLLRKWTLFWCRSAIWQSRLSSSPSLIHRFGTSLFLDEETHRHRCRGQLFLPRRTA